MPGENKGLFRNPIKPGRYIGRSLVKLLFISFFLAFIQLGPVGTLCGQPQRFHPFIYPRLQETLENTLTRIGVPGAVATVAGPNGHRWTGAAGVSELYSTRDSNPMTGGRSRAPNGKSMDPYLKFHVASVQKTFVATLIMMLVQDNVLGLEDHVEKWLPGLAPGGNHITIQQLLNHTSGVYNYASNPRFYNDLLKNPHRKWLPRDLIHYSNQNKLRIPKTGVWHYSNTNYILLGMIIEQATGQSYDKLLKSKIIDPLNLNNTSIPRSFTGPPGLSRGYRYNFQRNKGRWTDVSEFADPSFMGAAGAMISSADDLLIWLKALTEGRFLTSRNYNLMFHFIDTGEPGRMAGLGVESRHGAVGHAGDYVFGYQTWMFRYKGFDIVILTNGIPARKEIIDGPEAIFGPLRRILLGQD